MKEFYFIFKLFTKHAMRKFKSFNEFNLSKIQQDILHSLEINGCYIMPEFLEENEVKVYQDEINSLIQNSTTKVWRDKVDSDKRIYGANQVSSLIQKHHTKPFINQIIDTYEKSSEKFGFSMAARMDFKKDNIGSGGGWHRDRSDKWQSKSLLYLTEVNSSNGPFQFIKGSHLPSQIFLMWLKYGIQPSQTRIPDKLINQMIEKEPHRLIECTGKAGTILFVDTIGLHRGKPIEVGYRIAITTYFWTGLSIPEHIKILMQK